MGILSRFKVIMSSNIHTVLEKSVNPEKEIKETLRNLKLDLGSVNAEMNAIIAHEDRINRELAACRLNISNMQKYAVKSLEKDDETSARKFLEKKATFIEKEEKLKKSFEIAAYQSNQIKQMYNKLNADIRELDMRKNSLQNRATIAKSTITLNKRNTSISGFDSIKDKVNHAIDEAEALAELRGFSMKESTKKYDNNTIDEEIELLKKKKE